MRRTLRIIVIVLAWCLFASSAPAGDFVVDGRFEEWVNTTPLFEASPGGTGTETPAVARLWLASHRDRLFLRFLLPRPTVLQREGGLVLYVDADDNPGTGWPVEDLGAEWKWSFEDKEGRAYAMDVPVRITQFAVGLRKAPTLEASEFEVSFARDASVAGAPLMPGGTISLLLRTENGTDPPGGSTRRLTATLDHSPPPPGSPPAMDRLDPGHLRVLTYNVLFDGCFERPEPFRRVLRALDADVLSLQEIYQHSPEETRALVAGFLPETDWYVGGDGQGIILSRHPIRESGPVGRAGRGVWARIETPQGEIVLINPHPPCCEDDEGRQREFDAIAAWIRDARRAGRLAAETPVVIAGDTNLVGFLRQRATLLRGEIADTTAYGPPHPPDGDGTALADALPYHLTGREVYTWLNPEGPFAPGRLDYIVYSDSVLERGRSFVLWTPDLPEEYLRAAGLRREDTAVASDHLPVVADFYFARSSSSR